MCLVVFIAMSAIFAVAMVVAGFICQYKKNTPGKVTTYECGTIPFNDSRVRFDIKYFHYAILFLIFDIETIFLYPFAVSIDSLGIFAIFEAFLFLLILLLGLFFVIKRNFLRWN